MIDYTKPIRTKSGDAAKLVVNIGVTDAPYVVSTVLGHFFYNATGARRGDHAEPHGDNSAIMQLENI